MKKWLTNAALVKSMLDQAVAALKDGEQPIVHSDRECHNRWPGWIQRMEYIGLTRSMSEKGCSPDNALRAIRPFEKRDVL